MEWISVDKDLPKSYTSVLVAYAPKQPEMGGKKRYAIWNRIDQDTRRNLEINGVNVQDIDVNGFSTVHGHVTHWMEIPEAPRGQLTED